MRTAALLLAAAHLLAPALQAQQHTTGKFHGCPPEGKPKSDEGLFDPILNALKNRDRAPSQVQDRKLSDVIAHDPQSLKDEGKKLRENWSPAARKDAKEWETDGVRIEGRLIAIRTSEPEACNCGKESQRDMHVWIATQAKKAAKADRPMMQISPRTRRFRRCTTSWSSWPGKARASACVAGSIPCTRSRC